MLNWSDLPALSDSPADALIRRLRFIEPQMAALALETCAVFDPDGTLRMTRTGERNRIAFSASDDEQLRGAVFTHNHPSGAGFSLADIWFAHRYDLAEMRAIAGHMVWRLLRPAAGWNQPLCQTRMQLTLRRIAQYATDERRYVKAAARQLPWLLAELSLPSFSEPI